MGFILLATENADGGARIREILAAQGWWVTVVEDRQGALRAAADHEPRVVIVDGTAVGATELVRVFSSQNGGPGALVLGSPEGEHEGFALVEAGADEILSASPPNQDLIQAVERVAAIPHQSSDPSPLPIGRQLTAEEIFGDILSEVDSKVDLVAPPTEFEPEPAPEMPQESVAAGPDAESGEPPAEVDSIPEIESVSRGADEESGSAAVPLVESERGGKELARSADFDAASEDVQDSVELETVSEELSDIVETGSVVEEPPVAADVDAAVEEVSDTAEPESVVEELSDVVETGSVVEEPPVATDVDAAVEDVPDVAEPESSDEVSDASPPIVEESPPVPVLEVMELKASEKPEPPEKEELQSHGRELVSGSQGGGGERDFGQYRLEERIAVGGMAEVWRASMVGLEGFRKTVAIKRILPHLAENEEFVAMFVDEAKLAAQLSHENLVDIYDLGKIDGDFFIAMEYVEGRDLRSILNRLRKRREPMRLSLALLIAARTSAALDYAHTRLDADGQPLGLVHRDVSPRNILISDSGIVRLCDFGVAKAVSSVARTEIGALKGKIQYMSPEQAGGARVDARSDVYSLGGVLFEMVTGRRLFVEDTEITLLDAVRRGVTDDPRSIRADLPDEVNAVLLRALSKDPEDRYQSAGEMQRELDEVLFHLEPKPTQGALAQWMEEIFEETGKAQKGEDVEAVSDGGSTSAVLPASMPEQAFQPSAGEAVEAVEMPGEEETAETKVAFLQDRGRQFWFGIAAGLVFAVLLGFAVDYWLDRRAGSPPSPTTVIDEASSSAAAVEAETSPPAPSEADTDSPSVDQ